MHIMDYRVANDVFDKNTKADSRIALDVRGNCEVCGKAVNRNTCKTWVHLSVEGELLDPTKSSEDFGYNISMGFFPVGSECQKAIPAQFKTKA